MQRGFGQAQRGAVIPLVAICLAMLMGFGGMAVDIGFLEYQQQAQQAATDAAAAGGAQSAQANSCANTSAATTAVQADAAFNGYSSSQVTVNTPPSSGPYAGNACAVAVTITSNKQTFFSHIFGFNMMAETTQAVGLGNLPSNSGCIWLLSTSAQSNFSNTDIQTPHCKIYINDTANMSNSTINANYIGYAGSGNNIGGTTFTHASPAPMGVVTDPCSTISGCAWLTTNPPAASGCSTGSFTTNGQTIGSATQPTCYSSLTISGTDTACGLIEVTGTLKLANAKLTSCSSGVTFAMGSGSQTTNFSSATLTMSAPTTGNTADVLFWRSPSQGSAVDFSNCTCNLTGMIYFPTSQVDYSSASGAYAMLVFGNANFSTSSGVAIGTPPPGYPGNTAATLGE